MPDPPTGNSGRFIWHELVSEKPDASADYYSGLFDWEIRRTELEGGETYRMISTGGKDLGGIVPPDRDRKLPAQWIPFVTVADVNDFCDRATGLGAEVAIHPKARPGVGRFAVLLDPLGAPIAPFRAEDEVPPEPTLPVPGTFCWQELLTPDVQSSAEFYRELLGYWAHALDDESSGAHFMFRSGGRDAAGMMRTPPDASHSAVWLPYVAVDNVDATADRAEELGAKLWVPPTEIPDVGRFAVGEDPQGAFLAVFGMTLAA